MNLANKLAAVAGAVKYLQKDGYNSHHRYMYVSEAALAKAVSAELAKQGVAMIPFCEEMRVEGSLYTVFMRYDFTDGENTLSVRTVGQGQDKQDKGAYKAMTGALKYALRQTFLIPTGDDPEEEEAPQRAQPPEQTKPKQVTVKKRLWNVCVNTVGESNAKQALATFTQRELGKPLNECNDTDYQMMLEGLLSVDADERKRRLGSQ